MLIWAGNVALRISSILSEYKTKNDAQLNDQIICALNWFLLMEHYYRPKITWLKNLAKLNHDKMTISNVCSVFEFKSMRN